MSQGSDSDGGSPLPALHPPRSIGLGRGDNTVRVGSESPQPLAKRIGISEKEGSPVNIDALECAIQKATVDIPHDRLVAAHRRTVEAVEADLGGHEAFDNVDDITQNARAQFYGCYLLTTLKPSGRTYIGFTVNPLRRLRQHNGDIKGGAAKTKRAGPWRMIAVVYGFPNNISALRFEWAWQNPTKSTRLKCLGKSIKSTPAAKVQVLATMLRSPTWARLPLVLHWVDRNMVPTFEKLQMFPPAHMPILYGPISNKLVSCTDPLCNCTEISATAEVDLDDFGSSGTDDSSETESETGLSSPIYRDDTLKDPNLSINDVRETKNECLPQPVLIQTCAICDDAVLEGTLWMSCRKLSCINKQPRARRTIRRATPADNDPDSGCPMVAHTRCLAEYMLSSSDEAEMCIPVEGTCPGPGCDRILLWGDLVKAALRR